MQVRSYLKRWGRLRNPKSLCLQQRKRRQRLTSKRLRELVSTLRCTALKRVVKWLRTRETHAASVTSRPWKSVSVSLSSSLRTSPSARPRLRSASSSSSLAATQRLRGSWRGSVTSCYSPMRSHMLTEYGRRSGLCTDRPARRSWNASEKTLTDWRSFSRRGQELTLTQCVKT